MNDPISGFPFYRNIRNLNDAASHKLHLLEISIQISELTKGNGKTRTKLKKQKCSQDNPKTGNSQKTISPIYFQIVFQIIPNRNSPIVRKQLIVFKTIF